MEPDTSPRLATDIPGTDEFCRVLGVAGDRVLSRLRALIEECRPGLAPAERNEAIEQLGRFIVAGEGAPTAGRTAAERLELLVTAVERLPAARLRVAACLEATLAETSAERLFAVVGLPNDRGLMAETVDRLAHFVLPAPPDDHDLAALVARIVRAESDCAWITAEVEPCLRRFAAAMGAGWAPLREAAADAVGLLTARVAVLGTGEHLLFRADRAPIRRSPFFRLGRASLAEMPALIGECRAALAVIRDRLEESGVSVDVVYSIDAIERNLRRVEKLLPLAAGGAEVAELHALLRALGHGTVGERSFRQLLTDNMRLLARKIIERAGRTGEHYVTSSRAEYFRMLGSAGGGGVITAGTAVGKFLVKWGHFPLFIDGLFSSLVYAGSFLMIQFAGFTLATKQPSMTAAALAGTIRETAGPARMSELIALITRISRSQFAAAIGNVGVVIVVAFVCDLIYKVVTGGPFLDAATAQATIEGFHPLSSGTIPFAALTGVLLWMSSLAAGWFENWVVYRRLPEALAHHERLRRLVGAGRAAGIARWVEHQAAGIGGSVALGFFLGMTPAFAKFVGLPLDVRHVTLSSASLVLSVSSLGFAGQWGAVIWAWVGIGFIGLLNFGVSFALALFVALRARDVPRSEQWTLPLEVLRCFRRRPIDFLWPPKEAAAEAAHAPAGHP